ncbi:MAG: tetratricopeptide repeat protein [Ramlibacter sp.]
MMRFPLAALFAALLAASVVATPALAQPATETVAAAPANSGLDAELFYELLLGELNVQGSEPSAGFALILDAARRTNDPALYQRAVELAFEARSGDAALQAARAWRQAFPQSREANRYVLQILVALNRLPESVEPLKTEIALADANDRSAVIAAVARAYARATDKKQAATVLEQGLADYLNKPETGAAAWSAVGRLRLAAGDTAGALEAARRGQAAGPSAEGPVLLALELMDPKLPQAEAIVRTYMQGQPLPEMRLAYARALIDSQRSAEAVQQLQQVSRERPDFAEAWLAQGSLLVQDSQYVPAEAALKRYLALVQSQPASEERSRGVAQAYLSLSQIAEKKGDYAQANAYLDRIDNAQDLIQAQNRRASILARQGRMDEARKLIRSLPERTPADARLKQMAEVQLLRDNKQYKAAYDLLGQVIAKDPADADLLYDQAMLAEKQGKFDDMERLLRELMAKKPDYHHAYNALGYSLAERGVRLPEARQLVQKALDLAPGDPFISDSLAWVEFRMGNKAEALRILQAAYKERPDPEIAAHLGEVLWSLGQRDQAQGVWREGLLQGNDNETLQETLKRLKVKP